MMRVQKYSMQSAVIELLDGANQTEALAFLRAHEDSSQFLLNNLKLYGPLLTDHQNSGNFKILREGAVVKGVFCLSRRGNLLAQAVPGFARQILQSCVEEPVTLKGFVGDWGTIEPLWREFKSLNPGYNPSYESKEILYAYELKVNDPTLKRHPGVRFLAAEDFAQWEAFSRAYLEELGLPDDLNLEEKRRDFEEKVREKVWWGLFEGEQLLSRAALNSRSERVGQVGGVFTPKPFRQRGYAKLTMLHMLADCRELHGHAKNILFTGETDIPAQRLYESIGYARVGSFALILGA